MGEVSKIAWTDATFNPWIGCDKVSPGCKNCYAWLSEDIRWGKAKWGPEGPRILTVESYWQKPLKWDKQAVVEGTYPKVFCASLADVFEDYHGKFVRKEKDDDGAFFNAIQWTGPTVRGPDRVMRAGNMLMDPFRKFSHLPGYEVATIEHVRRDLFRDVIDRTQRLTWLVLTKRADKIQRFWPGGFRKNVWLGTTVENQQYALERIPHLVNCVKLAPIAWLSIEPLLGEVDLVEAVQSIVDKAVENPPATVEQIYEVLPFLIQWVIVGCESDGKSVGRLNGTEAQWWNRVRKIQQVCERARIPFFMKQGPKGGRVVHELEDFPEDIRIRESPLVCRSCGCHNYRGCFDEEANVSCHWVEAGLCSACVPKPACV